MELDCNNNCMEFECNIESNLPSSPDINDIVGSPQLNPRLGNEYQVEIPSVTTESEGLKLTVNPADSEAINGESLSFALGLDVPLIWIDNEVEDGSNEGQEHFRNNDSAVNAHEPEETSHVKPNITSENEKDLRARQQGQGKAYGSAPDKLSNSWSDADIKSFVLALFIFGKNFIQIKRFLENKGMGEILSFYYGKFYKSDEHVRWSDCRKIKGRKCMTGLKLFNGWRQHELLSRINSKVSEQVQDSLLQVSESYAEGRASLQEYIFSLKATVGLSTLVEAVAVGKDKADLTSFAAEPPKINPCKAWSSLEPCDIIKYLTGGFRLSKAKSNDLFWEAVWPRLLARGWHSEQPGSHNYALPSKNSLVFLVPGVKKYTRKLVKGNHYFDSVSDVLGKVASDPELIELESVTDSNCKSVEGNGWTNETKLGQENSPDQQRHCYLKPRTPNRSVDVLKFTVVDTSLATQKVAKVRELRNLPVGVLGSASENDSDSEDTSEEHTNESESVNTTSNDSEKADVIKSTKGNIGREVSTEIKNFKNKPSSEELPMGSTNLYVTSSSKDRKTDLLSNTHTKNPMKSQSSSRQAPDDKNVIGPVTKRRRRLSACSRAERNCNAANIFVSPRVKQEDARCCCDSSNSNKTVSLGENAMLESKEITNPLPRETKKLSDIFLSNTGQINSREAVPASIPDSSNSNKIAFPGENPILENKEIANPPPQELKTFEDLLLEAGQINVSDFFLAGFSSSHDDQHEKPQKRTMIDLNIPVSPEAEADELCNSKASETQQNNTREDKDDSCATMISNPEDNSEQPNTNTRRQSTRNRPLTTKALEAFAFGYLDRKEKRKGRDYPTDGSSPRPSRRARGNKTGGETSCSSGADFQKEERTNVACNGNGDVILTGLKSNKG